jgi:hypothetical protein
MKPLLPLAALLTASCIYLPRSTAIYDEECRVMALHMELETTQLEGFARCSNQGCVALLAAAGAVTAASAVVSGSIVVAGNVVYWFERRGRCNKDGGAITPPVPTP